MFEDNFLSLFLNLFAMTTTAIRKKIHKYVDAMEEDMLEAMYQMLKLHVDESSTSLMSKEQKSELEKRSKLYRQGKLKASSWEDVKQRVRASR
jgi:putative addiction module component (TIGR02574 family)